MSFTSLDHAYLRTLPPEELAAIVEALGEAKTCCEDKTPAPVVAPKKPEDPDANIDALSDEELQALLSRIGIDGFERLFSTEEKPHPRLLNDWAAEQSRRTLPEPRVAPPPTPSSGGGGSGGACVLGPSLPVPPPTASRTTTLDEVVTVTHTAIASTAARIPVDFELQQETRRRYVHFVWQLGSYCQGHHVKIVRENNPDGTPLWQNAPRMEGRHNGPGCVGAIYFGDFPCTRTVKIFADGTREEGPWRMGDRKEHRLNRLKRWFHQDEGGPGQGWGHPIPSSHFPETIDPSLTAADQVW
jgi:hypothetical protein